MSMTVADKIIQRLKSLKGVRGNFETHWQEVTDYVLTRKNHVTTVKSPGEKRNLEVFDDTAPQSLVLLSGALHGFLTNSILEWFELTTGDPFLDDESEMREFLGNTTIKMHNVINGSNFQTQIHEIYQDLGSIGTGAMAMMEDERDVVRFLAKHISEYYIDENNKGMVDTIYSIYDWDMRQIAQQFGIKNLPEMIREKVFKQPEHKEKIIHAIFPMEDMPEVKSRIAGNMKWASVWVMESKKIELKRGGFREFPFAVPRWTKSSGEMYGRSPSIQALPSIKMGNQMAKTMIESAQKHANPPLLVEDDGVISPVNTVPGGMTWVRPGLTRPPITPLLSGSRIDFAANIIQDNRRQIREAYFIDQLQLHQGPQMTATEVNARTEEKMRLLGPVLGRMQSELLRPMIDRIFDIMLRRKLIAKEDIPEALSGRRIDVQYKSLVARAQRITEADNINRAIQASASLIQLDPSVMDNYDKDEAIRRIARLHSVPQALIVDIEERDAVRKQRAAAAQEEAQRQREAEDANVGAVQAQTVTQLNNAG